MTKIHPLFLAALVLLSVLAGVFFYKASLHSPAAAAPDFITVSGQKIPVALVLSKAEAGDAESQYRIGQYYLPVIAFCNGCNVPPNYKPIEAMDWMRKAASQGYPAAQTSVALMRKMPEEERKKLLLSAAAGGDSLAMETIAGDYSSGTQGFEKDKAAALRWFLKAADGGNRYIQGELSRAYTEANRFDGNPNYAEAYFWLLVANGAKKHDYKLATSKLTSDEIREVDDRAGVYCKTHSCGTFPP